MTEQFPQTYQFKLYGKRIIGERLINGKYIRDPEFCFQYNTKEQAKAKYDLMVKVANDMNILDK